MFSLPGGRLEHVILGNVATFRPRFKAPLLDLSSFIGLVDQEVVGTKVRATHPHQTLLSDT